MCITQACENPTLPGVWWREDDRWCLYSNAHQQQIRDALAAGLQSIDLGVIRSDVHPHGARYTVDLVTMEQRALSSGFTRSILVIDRVAAPAVQQRSEVLSLPSTIRSRNRRPPIQLHYRDSVGNLVRYGSTVAQALWNAIYQGRAECFALRDSNSYYYFDFKRRTQLVATLSDGRFIFSEDEPVPFSIELAWSSTDMTLAVSKEKSWQRKMLEMLASKYGSQSRLEEILRRKALPKAIVRFKRASLIPGETAYENFLDSLDKAFAKCDPKFLGTIFKNVQDGRLETENGLLQLAFRFEATSDRKIDSSVLKREGAREGVEFWKCITSVLTAETLISCQNELRIRLAVFLILLPHSNDSQMQYGSSFGIRGYSTVHHHSNRLKVEKPEHCLRLARITVQ